MNTIEVAAVIGWCAAVSAAYLLWIVSRHLGEISRKHSTLLLENDTLKMSAKFWRDMAQPAKPNEGAKPNTEMTDANKNAKP